MSGWLSLIVHLVVILVAVEMTREGTLWDSVEPEAKVPTEARGGGGGREVAMIALPMSAPTPVVVRVPVTRPPPEPKTPTEPVHQPVLVPPADTLKRPPDSTPTTGSGGGTGGGSGSGAGPGSGAGVGPGTGVPGGTADSAKKVGRNPEPTRLILPPFDFPKAMRGQTIEVNFFVLADGRVDHVVLVPDIPDRGYAKKFEDAMRSYRFRPARSPDGTPIPGVAIVHISF